MNIILSSLTNCKFFQEISLYQLDGITTYQISIKDNLYSLYYQLKPNYIFVNVFEINHEIVQFAEEFRHDCVVYCYVPFFKYARHNIPNIPHVKYITRDYIDSLDNQKIIPHNIVNKKYLDSIKQEKIDQAVCFLDGVTQRDHKEKLLNILYPHKQNIKIKLFNDKSFQHPQNLGYLNHIDKVNMLARSQYAIIEDGSDYYYDALYLNCSIINIENITTNSIPNISETTIDNDIEDYYEYLQEIISQ